MHTTSRSPSTRAGYRSKSGRLREMHVAKYLRNHDAPTLGQLGKLTPIHSTGRRHLDPDACSNLSRVAKEVWNKRTPEQREEMKRKVKEGLAKARERRKQLGLG